MMRTVNCGELSKESLGKEVTLAGWVDTRRDHGNLIFIDLRDRWGVTQVVFGSDQDEKLLKIAETLRTEFVIQVKGKVSMRPDGTINKKLPTGEIEVVAAELKILNACPTPPFELGETSVNEELRLKYRFIDLRRADMVENLTTRYRITKVVRDYLDQKAFLEIETPYLTKSTPEGARDFLVPSRLSEGSFYALPQSPQLFKQLLMVAGYDRYFQLARCFRDEDLRSDRQLEHTQIDLEMSFVDSEDVMALVEGMVADVFDKVLGIQVGKTFKRMPYAEAINRFGSDKPDVRFGMELHDLNESFAGSGFKVFDSVIESSGKIRGLCFTPPSGVEFSRKSFDDLTEWIKNFGAKGLAYLKVTGEDSAEGPIAKFFDGACLKKVFAKLSAKQGDIIFMVASDPQVSAFALGALRCHLAETYNMIDQSVFELLWITDFPLFEWAPDEKRFKALHHPFTAPKEEDLDKLAGHPENVLAQAYDLVLNGVEIGGGSVRIHKKDIQDQVFRTLNISAEEAESKFGFLLKALSYGAPPHAGLAIGLDRFVALLLKRDSIREVIAFPKTQKGTCLMTDAPGEVAEEQMKELSLAIRS